MKQKKVQGDPKSGLGQDEEENEEIVLPRIDDLIEAAAAATKPKGPGYICSVCYNTSQACPHKALWGTPVDASGWPIALSRKSRI